MKDFVYKNVNHIANGRIGILGGSVRVRKEGLSFEGRLHARNGSQASLTSGLLGEGGRTGPGRVIGRSRQLDTFEALLLS